MRIDKLERPDRIATYIYLAKNVKEELEEIAYEERKSLTLLLHNILTTWLADRKKAVGVFDPYYFDKKLLFKFTKQLDTAKLEEEISCYKEHELGLIQHEMNKISSLIHKHRESD